MKPGQWLLSPILSFFIAGLTLGDTYPINVRYQPVKEFSSLQQKIGLIIGIAPFKDKRPDKLHIGHQTSFQRVSRYTSFGGVAHYFKSEPFPLEKAVSESLSHGVSRCGAKAVPISEWDGKPESLKNMDADSILMIEIKEFWTEGTPAVRGTNVTTSIDFVIHLGVKKEGRVFRKDVYAIKECVVPNLTPAGVEGIVNQILTEMLDNFFSNPY